MITKEDWEITLKRTEAEYDAMCKSYEMQKPQMEHILKFIKAKIKEFPQETEVSDPMPKDIKEVIKEVA